jgi:Uma2 family endonuclease
MNTSLRWVSADLELLPENGKRYEIIDGELFMSKAPRYEHQRACKNITRLLDDWSRLNKSGEAFAGSGVIFGDNDDVIPDVLWISRERWDLLVGSDGHFHGAPELVVEVLSFTGSNERRDREFKLKLYSRRDVKEYWIVDWLTRRVEVFRRRGRGLKLVETLSASKTLTSPLLPGFSCVVKEIFESVLTED